MARAVSSAPSIRIIRLAGQVAASIRLESGLPFDPAVPLPRVRTASLAKPNPEFTFQDETMITLNINGQKRTLDVDPKTRLSPR